MQRVKGLEKAEFGESAGTLRLITAVDFPSSISPQAWESSLSKARIQRQDDEHDRYSYQAPQRSAGMIIS